GRLADGGLYPSYQRIGAGRVVSQFAVGRIGNPSYQTPATANGDTTGWSAGRAGALGGRACQRVPAPPGANRQQSQRVGPQQRQSSGGVRGGGGSRSVPARAKRGAGVASGFECVGRGCPRGAMGRRAPGPEGQGDPIAVPGNRFPREVSGREKIEEGKHQTYPGTEKG